MTEQPEGTLLHRIVIERWLDADGEEVITTDKGDTSLLDVLGMLAFAQQSVWSDMHQDET
jgi:hypothetical protein